MAKKLGKYIAAITAVGIAYAAMVVFGIPHKWIPFAFIAIAAIAQLFNFESRLKRLEGSVVRDEFAGIKALINGDLHVPEQRPPASLVAGGAQAKDINAADEILFADFSWFATALNKVLPDPWSVEEISDTVTIRSEYPDIGRKYVLWFNSCRVGTLSVCAWGLHSLTQPEKFEENPSAKATVQLKHLRFIPYQDALALLHWLTFYITTSEHETADERRLRLDTIAGLALARYLWDAVRQPEADPGFRFSVEGSYNLFREIVGHWHNIGFDPTKV